VWVGHVVLETDRLEETEQFMRKIGMRSIVQRPEVAVLELRGGTHLVLIAKPEVVAGTAPFDLMVEDLRATHEYFVGLGLAPTPIETASPEHERFLVRSRRVIPSPSSQITFPASQYEFPTPAIKNRCARDS
jgi:hypothetical protein